MSMKTLNLNLKKCVLLIDFFNFDAMLHYFVSFVLHPFAFIFKLPNAA